MPTLLKSVPQPRIQPGFSPKPARRAKKLFAAEEVPPAPSPSPSESARSPSSSPLPAGLMRKK
jgi:hypothetical protein